MALTVSYPGVYVQEIGAPPPDVGVTTSLAAFIGRAPMGPVDTPVTVNNWGDYHRVFGGLDGDSSMSYQVSAFFENGGGQAVCVRLFEAPAGGDTDGCRATLSLGAGPAGGGAPLVLAAASPGSWGDRLSATVDTAGVTAEVARGLGVSAGPVNLTVACEAPNGAGPERAVSPTSPWTRPIPPCCCGHVLTEQSQLAT